MNNPTISLKNLARGNRTYFDGRGSVFKIISSSNGAIDLNIGTHLLGKLLKLPDKGWIPLALAKIDWQVLERLRESTAQQLEASYVLLVAEYIRQNAERTRRMYARAHSISVAILADNFKDFERPDWDVNDSLSMFQIKLFAAENAHSTELLQEHYRFAMPSSWMRNRFLYPFLNFCINNVGDHSIEPFLSFALNESYDRDERAVVRILLRDDLQRDVSLSFKCYVALTMHPYDASEMLLNYIEQQLALQRPLSEFVRSALDTIVGVTSSRRAATLLAVARADPIPFIHAPEADRIAARLDVDLGTAQLLADFVNPAVSEMKPSIILSEVSRMRSSRYPNTVDYDLAVTTFARWHFLEVGQLLWCLINALYLIPRSDTPHERKLALRLATLFGQVAPWMLATPEGASLPQMLHVDKLPSPPTDAVAQQLSHLTSCNDRRWMLATQWSLQGPQAAGRIGEWLSLVRSYVPIKPTYLTGIQWDWFDGMIGAVRLARFRGDPDACFALLLRQVEERTADAWLRTAIEPRAFERTFEQFVEWLLSTYGATAIAFVRYFLTPENILLMELAPNSTAALTSRISALRECVRRFGFSDLMTEKQFEEESKTLTASLLHKRASGSQFEIAWEIFNRDVADREEDSFHALRQFSARAGEQPLLGRARVETQHNYRNGKSVTYNLENKDWPIATAIISIVDMFIKHPSVGIEVLLSTRFRHDTMRREYERALDEARSNYILGIYREDREAIVDDFTTPILQAVSDWLNRRMQTQRPGREEGLFDLAPTQDEMLELVRQAEKSVEFAELVDVVVGWLKVRLREQVDMAKAAFDGEFRQQLSERVTTVRDGLLQSNRYQQADIRRVSDSVSAVLTQLTNTLQAWFATDTMGKDRSMSFRDLKRAADGLYEVPIKQKTLVTHCVEDSSLGVEISPERVRLYYDLLDELYANAIKYGPPHRARVRISILHLDGGTSLLFSSPAADGDRRDWEIEGESYQNASDTIFGERSSGLRKIAAIAATLSTTPVRVHAHRRRQSFHLIVPFTG